VDENFKQSQPDLEKLRQLDRTAFLISTAAVQDSYKRRLEEALAKLPGRPADVPIDTDDKLVRETLRIDGYLDDVRANLDGSHWVQEFNRVCQHAEHQADSDLLRMDISPEFKPMIYRRFHIAAMKRDTTQAFLERSIEEAKQHDRQMLQMLRERPDIHSGKRG
jgi:hypothetical protein